MAATPEKKVKAAVVKQLKELGAYYFYPVTGGYGASGVPDIVGCYNGYFFAIECKAGKNTPTPLQLKNIKAITDVGGIVTVVNETNLDEVTQLLTAVRKTTKE
jgi:Holliday junction resolvase